MIGNEEEVHDTHLERSIHQRLLAMLDSSPLCTFIMDDNFNVVDCNQVAVSLFEFRDKRHFVEQVFQIAHKYQSQEDGALIMGKIQEALPLVMPNLNGRLVL